MAAPVSDKADDRSPAEPSGGVGAVVPLAPKPIGPYRRAARRFVRNKASMLGLIVLALIGLTALFAPAIANYAPDRLLDLPWQGVSKKYWLGTDDIGRDTFSRLVHAARIDFRISFQVVFFVLLISLPIGLTAGTIGGRVDYLIMRCLEALSSFPPLILALAIAGILGPGITNLMIATIIVFIPGFVRLVRAQALAVSEEVFIEASRSIGTPTPLIMLRRVLPNLASPLIVQTSVALGAVALVSAALGFLGLGPAAPTPTWGGMVRKAFEVLQTNPNQILPGGIAIAVLVLCFNVVGDGLRDALGLGIARTARIGRRDLAVSAAQWASTLAGVAFLASLFGLIGGGAGVTLALLVGVGALLVAGTVLERRAGPTVSRLGTTAVAPAVTDTLRAGGEAAETGASAPILAVRDLGVSFRTEQGEVRVVDGVSFDVKPGEVVGLVGESGSGKTVTSLAVMRLIPSPPGTITGGSIRFEGRELLGLTSKQLRELRGDGIAMIFQDPQSSLNPSFTIGNQLIEAIRLHRKVTKAQAHARAVELLEQVGINDALARMKEYPHRLSGGMRQRVMIAMALTCDPRLLIADEPTTALDVTVQAQILDLLKKLQRELGMSMIFVTHDLGVVAEICDRVVVLYAGQVVEQRDVRGLFGSPRHPYTSVLLEAIPAETAAGERLVSIPGVVPPAGQMPLGCRFGPRCRHATPACHANPVPLALDGERSVRCIRADELVLPGAQGAHSPHDDAEGVRA